MANTQQPQMVYFSQPPMNMQYVTQNHSGEEQSYIVYPQFVNLQPTVPPEFNETDGIFRTEIMNELNVAQLSSSKLNRVFKYVKSINPVLVILSIIFSAILGMEIIAFSIESVNFGLIMLSKPLLSFGVLISLKFKRSIFASFLNGCLTMETLLIGMAMFLLYISNGSVPTGVFGAGFLIAIHLLEVLFIGIALFEMVRENRREVFETHQGEFLGGHQQLPSSI